MAFTLVCDFRAMDGVSSTRITQLEVLVSHQIGDAQVVYERTSVFRVVDGYVEIDLPASAVPSEYVFYVSAPQQDMHWVVPPQAESSVVYLSQFTTLTGGSSSGDGSGIVPMTSANSGTAYTVTAPTHGERRLKLILTGNATLTLSGGTADEVCAVQLHLIQDSTGSRTVTWPGNIQWGLNGPPVLSTVTGKTDIVYLTTDDGGSSWQGALVGNGFTSPTIPSAPTGLGAVFSGNPVVLTWTQGASNGATVTFNKIYKGTVSGSLSLLATIPANTTYTDTTTTAGGTYFYKVSAVNVVGEGAQSSEVAPSTLVVSDNFNAGTDTATGPTDGLIGNVTPVGAKTWLNLLGTGTWSVAGNVAVCSATNKKAGVDSAVANCTVAVDFINTAAMSNQGIVFRWVDANNFCTAILDPTGYYVQKTIAGVQTNVAGPLGGAIASGADMRLSVVLSGSSVIVKADGVTKITTTISDAAVLTATKHGIMTGGTFSDVSFDNFEVTVP